MKLAIKNPGVLVEQLEINNLFQKVKIIGNIWILNVFQRDECTLECPFQEPQIRGTKKMSWQSVLEELRRSQETQKKWKK